MIGLFLYACLYTEQISFRISIGFSPFRTEYGYSKFNQFSISFLEDCRQFLSVKGSLTLDEESRVPSFENLGSTA